MRIQAIKKLIPETKHTDMILTVRSTKLKHKAERIDIRPDGKGLSGRSLLSISKSKNHLK